MERDKSGKPAAGTRGLVVAGLGGGSGKSVIAVGLSALFCEQGRRVVTFKKGPDYIDAGWLALASRGGCYNLDPYLMPPETIAHSFRTRAEGAELVLVEGNRGLYDGVDVEGAYSTAELAGIINLPILLVVNCTKTTRTVAAMVLGCLHLQEGIDIRGVVLNQVGTGRHQSIVRQSIERYTGLPVFGAMPRMGRDIFPMRHLGVTPCPEYEGAAAAVAVLATAVGENLEVAAIERAMGSLPVATEAREVVAVAPAGRRVRIGVLRDAAFQFYYADNLIALVEAGAELVELNALRDRELPALDGLYIGGGFPETNVKELAENGSFRESVRRAADAGLPIYAECGGLIYLGESLTMEGREYPLVGIFPVRFGMAKKPQAHGYTNLTVRGENPFYPRAAEIRGHEFRYSKVLSWAGRAEELVFTLERGVGFSEGRDGLVHRNVLALYTHIHALGTPEWAGRFVAKAREFQAGV